MATGAERRAKRDLDAARVRGDLPPEQNPVTGELINPHIPEFMAKAPWYAKAGQDKGAGLAHQRLDASGAADQSIAALAPLYRRGALGARAAGFRAGACRNCGAGTHVEKDCVERPRKAGAWKTGSNIARDEVIPGACAPGLKLGWDAKRDSFAGYDDSNHTEAVAARFRAVDAERESIRAAEKAAKAAEAAKEAEEKAERRRQSKAARLAAGGDAADDDATDSGGDGFGPSSDDEAGGAPIAEEKLGAGVSGDAPAGAKTMVGWNVRVREDTAKYLLNLDVDSAFYDPKTRSMRENPYAGTEKEGADVLYKGDNVWRQSAAASDVAKAELFAWDAYNATGSSDVHALANPTQSALLRKTVDERKTSLANLQQQRILETYGSGSGGGASEQNKAGFGGADGSSGAALLPAALRLGVSEAYVEYAPDGTIARAPTASDQPPAWPKPITADSRDAKSEHRPGPLRGRHSSIFGSWYDRSTHKWGFACCHNVLAGAYCTGAAGRAAEEASRQHFEATAARDAIEAAREGTETSSGIDSEQGRSKRVRI